MTDPEWTAPPALARYIVHAIVVLLIVVVLLAAIFVRVG